MEKLTRATLFELVSNKLNIEIIQKLFLKPETIIELFSDSSIFIDPFELEIMKDTKEETEVHFFELFNLNLENIKNQPFKKYVEKEIFKLRTQGNDKPKSFKDWLNHLIRIIAKYHTKMINSLYIFPKKDSFEYIRPENYPQTFLSYSYDDKGITLGLYLYFLKKNGFLYIDWMWKQKIKKQNIKISINSELRKSTQFLFLRSPNSELETKSGKRMIRQWCSWEIGNYYNLKSNKKYYTNFYSAKKPTNELLCDFKQAYYVYDGLIH